MLFMTIPMITICTHFKEPTAESVLPVEQKILAAPAGTRTSKNTSKNHQKPWMIGKPSIVHPCNHINPCGWNVLKLQILHVWFFAEARFPLMSCSPSTTPGSAARQSSRHSCPPEERPESHRRIAMAMHSFRQDISFVYSHFVTNYRGIASHARCTVLSDKNQQRSISKNIYNRKNGRHCLKGQSHV